MIKLRGDVVMHYIERKTCWMRSFLDMPLSMWACIMSWARGVFGSSLVST